MSPITDSSSIRTVTVWKIVCNNFLPTKMESMWVTSHIIPEDIGRKRVSAGTNLISLFHTNRHVYEVQWVDGDGESGSDKPN